MLCCLALLTAAEGHAAAVVIAEQAGERAGRHEGRTRIAAEGLTFSVKPIEADSGTETPLAIHLPSAAELRAAGAETGANLLIRNIPQGVTILPGEPGRRVRVVPLREASKLRLASEPGTTGRFQLEFFLIDLHNRALAHATAAVDLRQGQAAAAPVPAAPPRQEPTPPAQPAPQARPLTPQAEALLLARGRDVLRQGSIAAARIIFEELATRGSAAAAFALAQSYDPAHLPPSDAPAPPPDLAEARKWYERAAELGNPDARQRLAEINSGR